MARNTRGSGAGGGSGYTLFKTVNNVSEITSADKIALQDAYTAGEVLFVRVDNAGDISFERWVKNGGSFKWVTQTVLVSGPAGSAGKDTDPLPENLKKINEILRFDPKTDMLTSKSAIQTTVNSLYLGEHMKISSGGDNVYFTSLVDREAFYPVMGAVKDQRIPANQGKAGIIKPFARIYGDNLMVVEPNKNQTCADGITTTYDSVYHAVDNIAFYGMTIVYGEEVTVGQVVRYSLYNNTDQHKMFSYPMDITAELAGPAGTEVTIWFSQPVDILSGDNVKGSVHVRDHLASKDTYRLLNVYAVDSKSTEPYRVAHCRTFKDTPIPLKSGYCGAQPSIHALNKCRDDGHAVEGDIAYRTDTSSLWFLDNEGAWNEITPSTLNDKMDKDVYDNHNVKKDVYDLANATGQLPTSNVTGLDDKIAGLVTHDKHELNNTRMRAELDAGLVAWESDKTLEARDDQVVVGVHFVDGSDAPGFEVWSPLSTPGKQPIHTGTASDDGHVVFNTTLAINQRTHGHDIYCYIDEPFILRGIEVENYRIPGDTESVLKGADRLQCFGSYITNDPNTPEWDIKIADSQEYATKLQESQMSPSPVGHSIKSVKMFSGALEKNDADYAKTNRIVTNVLDTPIMGVHIILGLNSASTLTEYGINSIKLIGEKCASITKTINNGLADKADVSALDNSTTIHYPATYEIDHNVRAGNAGSTTSSIYNHAYNIFNQAYTTEHRPITSWLSGINHNEKEVLWYKLPKVGDIDRLEICNSRLDAVAESTLEMGVKNFRVYGYTEDTSPTTIWADSATISAADSYDEIYTGVLPQGDGTSKYHTINIPEQFHTRAYRYIVIVCDDNYGDLTGMSLQAVNVLQRAHTTTVKNYIEDVLLDAQVPRKQTDFNPTAIATDHTHGEFKPSNAFDGNITNPGAGFSGGKAWAYSDVSSAIPTSLSASLGYKLPTAKVVTGFDITNFHSEGLETEKGVTSCQVYAYTGEAEPIVTVGADRATGEYSLIYDGDIAEWSVGEPKKYYSTIPNNIRTNWLVFDFKSVAKDPRTLGVRHIDLYCLEAKNAYQIEFDNKIQSRASKHGDGVPFEVAPPVKPTDAATKEFVEQHTRYHANLPIVKPISTLGTVHAKSPDTGEWSMHSGNVNEVWGTHDPSFSVPQWADKFVPGANVMCCEMSDYTELGGITIKNSQNRGGTGQCVKTVKVFACPDASVVYEGWTDALEGKIDPVATFDVPPRLQGEEFFTPIDCKGIKARFFVLQVVDTHWDTSTISIDAVRMYKQNRDCVSVMSASDLLERSITWKHGISPNIENICQHFTACGLPQALFSLQANRTEKTLEVHPNVGTELYAESKFTDNIKFPAVVGRTSSTLFKCTLPTPGWIEHARIGVSVEDGRVWEFNFQTSSLHLYTHITCRLLEVV